MAIKNLFDERVERFNQNSIEERKTIEKLKAVKKLLN